MKVKAFTLTELMVVLVIIGILMLLALPRFSSLISRAHELEAKRNLQFLHSLQNTHYQSYFKYSTDEIEIGFESPRTILEGGEGKYQYEIVNASTDGFLARAKAIADFDRDGVYNVWEINEEGELKRVVAD